MNDSIGQAALAYAAPKIGEAVAESVREGLNELSLHTYLIDVVLSARLLAHFEMGGKLNDRADGDDYRFAKELMAKGSASLFFSERAKFAQKLREEKSSNSVLAKITFEIEDDNPQAWSLIDFFLVDKSRSRLLFNASDWRENPKTVAPDTPAVLMFINRRAKDAKEKNPVTVHCSFVFTAVKEGRAVEKTLAFDLYLESLQSPKAEGLFWPWKVKNVQYK